MSKKKAGGSSSNGRDSESRRLGLKRNSGQFVKCGTIIARQRGSHFFPGEGAFMSKDYTIHAHIDGIVSFKKGYKRRTYINVSNS